MNGKKYTQLFCGCFLLYIHERRFFLYNHDRKRGLVNMKTNEHDYYSNLANWSFDDIDYFTESFTNWVYE